MAIQVVVRSRGGTIETQFLDRHPASCVVTLYTNQGSAKVTAQTCTIDALNTTIATEAVVGDLEIDLASATSCIVGRRYLLGTAGTGYTPETVTVRSLAASTATLTAPLLAAHPFGEALKGVRASYTVSTGACDSVWINGVADFDPQDGSDVQSETVECYFRKIPEQGCDASDLRLVFPAAGKALDAELDIIAAIKQARDRFLYDLGGKNRAHAFIGTDIFRDAVAIKFWLLRRVSFGEDWKIQMDELQKTYDGLIMDLQQQQPADNDQDGVTGGLDDGGFVVATVERA